jgi:hypothetical protein
MPSEVYKRFWNKILLSYATGICILLGTFCGQAGESIWIHNGSKIRWVSDGYSRRAYYVEPKHGLDEYGIYPGQLLFEGHRHGYVVEGRAFTFKRGCSPLGYSVSANLRSETTIIFEGLRGIEWVNLGTEDPKNLCIV